MPPRTARQIRDVGASLAAAPSGPLFVSGGAPGWYLVSGRRNPTRFDALVEGLGTTEPEVSDLLAALRADPPAVVMIERGMGSTADYSHEKLWSAIGHVYTRRTMAGLHSWEMFVAEDLPGEEGFQSRSSIEGGGR